MQNKYTVNSCGIYDCDAEWSWKTNGSKDYTLWAVFRGEGTLSLDNTEHSVKSGSCFLIPPKTLTYGTHNPSNRLFVYAVHFSKDGNPFEIDYRRISNISFFKELFSRVILFYNMNRTALVHSYLEVLLNEFLSSPDAKKDKQTPENATHQKYLTEICDRINSAPEAKHSLSALAAEYGYSGTYLGKLFHKNIGISFSSYLLNARINYAKLLLLNSKLSVGEIAERLGYYDTAHFINQFKKTVGCTPNAYR